MTFDLDHLSLLRLTLACLTCYRLSRLITLEDGPNNSILRWRLWLSSYDLNKRTGRPRLGLQVLLTCPYCLGLWIALFILPFTIYPTQYTDLAFVLFSLSGVQCLLQDYTTYTFYK